jgi:5-methylcytosine-specific restriction protein A
MPTAPLRPCATAGCPVLVTAGHCPAHQRQPWANRHGTQRMRGRKLQRERARLFDQQTLCVLCLAQGRYTVATIRDHIVPLFKGGPDEPSNTQPLCQACSDAKTQAEAREGRMHPPGG